MKYLMDLKNNGKAIIHKQYDFYNPNAKVCAGEKFLKKAQFDTECVMFTHNFMSFHTYPVCNFTQFSHILVIYSVAGIFFRDI